MTALLKKIRESDVSIDDAAKACHTGAPPDKHKEAMRFMEPLAQDLLKCVLAKAPVRTSDASDELAKAKAKLAEHGIVMSPLKTQLLDNPFPDQWVMAPWQALRSNAARTALVRKYQRPFASLKDPERFRCAQFLLSLFPEPVTDNTVGQEEFFGFVNCILQSRLNYERHFQEGASLFHNVEENVVGYRFKCVGFPGPPVAAQNWHLWAHATTREGATGILATGKILPTDHQVADLEAHEDTFSFFGRSMSNPDWNTGVVQKL